MHLGIDEGDESLPSGLVCRDPHAVQHATLELHLKGWLGASC
jgi:hypothetical protein